MILHERMNNGYYVCYAIGSPIAIQVESRYVKKVISYNNITDTALAKLNCRLIRIRQKRNIIKYVGTSVCRLK